MSPVSGIKLFQISVRSNWPLVRAWSRDELIAAQGALNALQQDSKLKKNRVLRREKAKLDFHKGDSVLVKSYGQVGVLMEQLDDQHWEVQLGILKMKIATNDLEKAQDPAKSAKQPRASVKRSGSSGMSATLDLRGHRYEEAMAEVDRYIDSALLAGYPSVTIIHGKGTGALRKGVTDYLKRNNRIKSFGFLRLMPVAMVQRLCTLSKANKL